MSFAPTPQQHAALSWAVLAALLLAAATVVLRAPIVERYVFADRLELLRDTHAKSVAAIARSEAAREALDQRQTQSDVGAQLYQAETAAIAGAQLQNDLRALIEAERGVLVSSAFLQKNDALPLTAATVSVRLRCSVEALMRILQGLDGRAPALFVENLVVQSHHRPGQPVAAAADELDVEFDVTGYLDRASVP